MATDPTAASAPAPPRPTDSKARRRNLRAMLLSLLIPGLGHMTLGYLLTGSLLTALFVLSANGLFLSLVLLGDPPLARLLLWTSAPLVGTLWVASLAHCWRLSFGTNHARLSERRRSLLRRALICVLRQETEGAHRLLRRAIRYDRDRNDVALYFHLGICELRLAQQLDETGGRGGNAQRRAARRSFNRCLTRDPEKRWRRDIQRACAKHKVKAPKTAPE